MHTDKKATIHLIEILVRKGINDFIISPGSRNAPLIKELLTRKDVNLYSIVDERSAAFVAIGIYLKTKKAAALICTSGSALLNYSPAVAEAFYQSIPLIVISADRPAIWIDQGEGQTIRQRGALNNFILNELNISLDVEIKDYSILDTEICSTIDHAIGSRKGPVHINIEYDEPLYKELDTYNTDTIKVSQERFQHAEPISIDKYEDRISSSKRVMILCGQLLPNPELSSILDEIAGHPQIIVLTESTSNLHSPLFIPSIDKTLLTLENNFEAYQPDILISIGDAIISKIIKRVLRKHSPKEHWQINASGLFRDTFQCLSDPIKMDPFQFFTLIKNRIRASSSSYADQWLEKYKRACDIYKDYKQEYSFSDLSAFDFLLNTIPEGSDIHISNSSPIRYQQLFESKKHNTYCNRGTSGIDGCSSTALGFSLKNDKTTFLISGDVSFLYDSNAWWNNYKSNLKIILINNGGGGIFRIIPGPMSIPEFETYFETRSDVDISHFCRAFNIAHFSANDQAQLKAGFSKLVSCEGVALLEVKTKAENNAPILNNYFKRLKAEDV